MRLDVLQAGQQRGQWLEVLARSFQHDFYHLPEYHTLTEEQGQGSARLFVYEEGDYLLALPLLLRPILITPDQPQPGEAWWDATSVYGYAGPLASHVDLPNSVLRNFWAALRQMLLEHRVVTVFSRLHPFIDQRPLLAGLGDWTVVGPTVSIDLTLPVEVQRAQYRKNHKHGINKLKRMGITSHQDQPKTYLNEFINIYYETLHRVQAAGEYFFDRKYFNGLAGSLASPLQLFVCLFEGEVICAGLFTLCNGIVQYHLGGTRNDFYDLAPMKLLFDTVRLWATEAGAHTFHLGGGVGARADSLFQFKAGFSNRRHEFAVWRWTLLPEIYEQLCHAKSSWNRQHGLIPVASNYFPAYRCPARAAQTETA